MRRNLLTLLAFLAVGAVVSLAIAWGCVVLGNPGAFVPLRFRPGTNVGSRCLLPEDDWSLWCVQRPNQFPREPSALNCESKAFGVSHGVMDSGWLNPEPPSHQHHLYALQFVEAGVPLPCMRGGRFEDYRSNADAAPPTLGLSHAVGVLSLSAQDQASVLPLLPMWTNFAANSVFYATLLWMAIRTAARIAAVGPAQE